MEKPEIGVFIWGLKHFGTLFIPLNGIVGRFEPWTSPEVYTFGTEILVSISGPPNPTTEGLDPVVVVLTVTV